MLLPFGSDIAVPGHLGPTEAAFRAHYGYVLDQAEAIRRRVDRLCASADLVIKTLQVGYLPRHDAFWSHGLAVDTERVGAGRPATRRARRESWSSTRPTIASSRAPTPSSPRSSELRGEGHAVRLVLLEGRPNEEVRDTVRAADVAVDQLLTGYGLFAVEAMAAGLPVISNLRWMPDWMRSAPSLTAAPIVDADEADVTDRLRELVVDRRRCRRRLGARAGASPSSTTPTRRPRRVWVAIVEHVWSGAPLPPGLAPVTDESSGSR